MKLSAYVELLQKLPQDLEVLSVDTNDNPCLGDPPIAQVVHAAEDGDGVVRDKVQGHGVDYVRLF